MRRSFAGEGLERERFGGYVAQSYQSGLGFARAKATLESLNRHAALLPSRGTELQVSSRRPLLC